MLAGILAVLVSTQGPVSTFDLSGPPHCAACRIELTKSVSLRDSGNFAILTGPPASIVRLPNGSYLVTTGRAQPVTYDRRGLPHTSWGRIGNGPGEFRIAQHLMIEADTVDVIDPVLRRRTSFNVNGNFISTSAFDVGPMLSILRLASDRYLANGPIRTPEATGYPLHILDGNGRRLSSFGAEPVAWHLGDAPLWRRRVAAAGGHRLWVAQETDYQIEFWDLDHASLIARFTRSIPWFTQPEVYDGPTPTRAPQPYIAAIRVDPQGLLWILITAPDPHWAQGLGQPTTSGNRSNYPIDDYDRVFDTVIEVVDPVQHSLIASERFDQYLLHIVLNDGSLAGYRETDGGPVIDVFGVHLRGYRP